jgi:hypothetical protein
MIRTSSMRNMKENTSLGQRQCHVILKNGEVELVGKTKEVLNIM